MKKRKMKKSVIIILFGILFIILILIGWFSLVHFSTKPVEKKLKVQKEKVEMFSYGIFEEYYDQALKKVTEMSLEEKIGQLFLVRYNYYHMEEYKDYFPGGYILFASDFQYHNRDSIKEQLDYVQSIHKYPLILGVDEEGGGVTRVSLFSAFRSSPFETPRYYYDQGGFALLEEKELEKIELLKSIGINLNLAPVADVPMSSWDFIYRRSFGTDVDLTSEYIKNMVLYAKKGKINSCLKHFPGYGNNVDTHTGVAIDERSYENFLERDFKPFQVGIDAGVPCILVSHNIVNSIDSEYPSSLSEKVIHELRATLKFSGVVMTDDLAMDAVSYYVQDGRAATLAINAGNDMIITSDFITMRNEVLSSVQDGVISMERINEAATKVIAWKYYSGLF